MLKNLRMKVAVIGAARHQNGIGEYIAKYFHMQGLPVVAVLGRNESSSEEAAQGLRKYGIRAEAYTDFKAMIVGAGPDIVAIASPTETHAAYIERCIAAGVHVFCDKPFTAPDTSEGSVERLLGAADAHGLVVGMNSQWPFTLPYYEELCGRIADGGDHTFYIRLSPMVAGREMIPDSVPHGLSILHGALGSGEIQDIVIRAETTEMRIHFAYCTQTARYAATIELVREERQPRTFAFGFDGRIVTRSIDLGTYAMSFGSQGRTLAIPDPLELSVKDFVSALDKGHTPLIGPAHILNTTVLLQRIYSASGA